MNKRMYSSYAIGKNIRRMFIIDDLFSISLEESYLVKSLLDLVKKNKK